MTHDHLKDYIRKILYIDRWIIANMEPASREVLQNKSDEAESLMVKLLHELQLPSCSKYQSLFVDYDNTLDDDALVENILKKLVKSSYKWNKRTFNDIDILNKYLVDPNRDSFNTLPELGIKNSPFTDFLLDEILMTGMATPLQVYEQLKLVENKNLHNFSSNLFKHPEKEEQLKFLENIGVKFLDEYLISEQKGEAFSKEIEGRTFFNDAKWEDAMKSFIVSANLSDNHKAICYPFICICCILLKMNIASEEYLYKSAEFFNSENDECARLYALALAGHEELEMANQIFTRSLKGEIYYEDEFENYLQISEIRAILNKLMNYESKSYTFLPPTFNH